VAAFINLLGGENMSNCCKCGKWWPHNWLCLKSLYWVFIALFYLTLVSAVYFLISAMLVPAGVFENAGQNKWFFILNTVTPILLGTIMSLTIAKMIKVLRFMKQALTPCACEAEHEVTTEEVVEEESK
jgi:hypothetical protein